MDPLARKLFKTRDAREKLRGMGGIMASSPELAQTVAQYQDGGRVEGPNTAQLRQFTGIRNQLSEMQARNAVMQEQFRRREAARQAAAAKRFDIQALDPSFNLTTIPALDRFGELEDSIDIARLPEQGPVAPTAPVGSDGTARERTADAARILIENGMAPAEVQRMIDQGIDLNYLLAQLPPGTVPSIDAERPTEVPGAAAADFAEAEAARARPAPPVTRGTPLFEQSVELLPPGVEPSITEEVRPDRSGRAALMAQMEEEMRNRAAQEGRARSAEEIIQEEIPPAPPEDQTGEQDGAVAPETGTEGTGAAIARGDFDTTYEQMLGRLQTVLGTDDKPSREKAMANLAMIGLAIASGQSPNALTNIAQGALVGMQGIEKASAARDAQERETQLAAIKMAADEVELTRRLESAERIAGMRGSGGTGTYTPERLYQQNLDAILRNPDMFDVFDENNLVDPNRATALAESLSQRGMTVGGGDRTYTPGEIAVQDGVTYEYQQDGSWQQVVE